MVVWIPEAETLDTVTPVVLYSFPLMETLTSRQAAERLGVNVQKFHRLVAAKDIQPALRAPGKRGAAFWDPADIERLRDEAVA